MISDRFEVENKRNTVTCISVGKQGKHLIPTDAVNLQSEAVVSFSLLHCKTRCKFSYQNEWYRVTRETELEAFRFQVIGCTLLAYFFTC